MQEKKSPIEMAVEPTVENYAIMLSVIAPAFRTVLEDLAVANGGKSGAWLDDLERRLVLDAKGTEVSGLTIPTEATGLTHGIDLLKNMLEIVRRNLPPDHPSA